MITSKPIAAVASGDGERFVATLNQALHDVRACASAAEFEQFKTVLHFLAKAPQGRVGNSYYIEQRKAAA